MTRLRAAAFLVVASVAGAAQAQLNFEVAEPAFRVSVPTIPFMKLGPHPSQATQPHLLLMGSKDAYSVSVLAPTADAGMKALECASSTVSRLPQRFGVPPLERIQRARLGGDTYIAMYASPMPGFLQLHAHIMSAAAGTHCVEVHISKVASSREDAEAWFTRFGDARIDAR